MNMRKIKQQLKNIPGVVRRADVGDALFEIDVTGLSITKIRRMERLTDSDFIGAEPISTNTRRLIAIRAYFHLREWD